MEHYLNAFRKYADFKGRSRRSEYWMFTLINLIIYLVLAFLESTVTPSGSKDGGIFTSIYALAILIPSIAVGARRLHDIGKSGWWLLIGLIPLIGSIILIVFYCKDSQVGTNQYGPNPKDPTMPTMESEAVVTPEVVANVEAK